MTISYTGRFGKLLFRWKASIYKEIWKEVVLYLALYYLINCIYRFALPHDYQLWFVKVVIDLSNRAVAAVPMAFLLGNYVVTVVKRWWEQFENIAWPDEFLFLVSAHIRGKSDKKVFLRRNIARYCISSAVLAWRNISSRVLKRFPTADHLSHSGLMTEQELKMYRHTKAPFGRWFIPLNWIQIEILKLKDNKELDSGQTQQLLASLDAYRRKFIRLFVCDWISIPLAYTQLATVTTYSYFAITLVAHQEVNPAHLPPGHTARHVDMYFPVLAIMQLVLYIGWLNVAQRLVHPFGEEDDDFELNYIIDRHLYISYMIVDETHGVSPSDAERPDPFWGIEPYLPHTKASQRIQDHDPSSQQTTALPFDEMALLTSRSSVPLNLTLQPNHSTSRHLSKDNSLQSVPELSDEEASPGAAPLGGCFPDTYDGDGLYCKKWSLSSNAAS